MLVSASFRHPTNQLETFIQWIVLQYTLLAVEFRPSELSPQCRFRLPVTLHASFKACLQKRFLLLKRVSKFLYACIWHALPLSLIIIFHFFPDTLWLFNQMKTATGGLWIAPQSQKCRRTAGSWKICWNPTTNWSQCYKLDAPCRKNCWPTLTTSMIFANGTWGCWTYSWEAASATTKSSSTSWGFINPTLCRCWLTSQVRIVTRNINRLQVCLLIRF